MMRPNLAREGDSSFVLVAEARAIRRYFSRRLPGRGQDVEDLTQEVCVRYLESALADTPRCTRAFLFGIARHVLADFLHSKYVVQVSWSDAAEDELAKSSSRYTERDPAEIVNTQRRLDELLSQLPPLQRNVLLAHELAGFSYQETAGHFDISDQTVEKYLFLAKSFLRAIERRSSTNVR